MPVDIAMAHNANVRAIGVDYGNATREELEEAGADWIVNNITRILDIIK
jgi:phosphoglycolate phosphatase